jgi:hypothetical protein
MTLVKDHLKTSCHLIKKIPFKRKQILKKKIEKNTLEWEFFITLTWRNNKRKIMFCIPTATTSFNTVNILVQKFMCHRTNKIMKKKELRLKYFRLFGKCFRLESKGVSNRYQVSKGQLISKCPIGVFKKPTKFL